MLHEMLGDGERIREDLQTAGDQIMHHLKCSGAAVDDDGVPLRAQRHGLPGNRPLLGDVLAFRHAKRLGRKAADLSRMKRLRPTANPTQAPLNVQGRDVAADRGLRGGGQLHKILDCRDRLLLDGAQDDPVPFTFVHGSSTRRLKKDQEDRVPFRFTQVPA
jgi:hypothetical protein